MPKFFPYIIGLIVIFNIAILDIVIFHQVQQAPKINLLTTSTLGAQPAPEPTPLLACPQSCISLITQASNSAQPTASAGISPPKTQPIAPTASQVREFFVPFGAGSSTLDDWADIPGLQASVDTRNYPSIKKVTFEATIRIPTGNETAYVRLYNETDKHPVWFSDVSVEGGLPQLVISPPITLDAGNKLYQVQMKTTLKYEAFVDQNRLHITTY